MSEEILDSLVCGICLDYCNDAMETSCCHKLYCNRCIMQIDSKCPICRKKCHYTRSIVAQRMINSLPIECPYCKNKFARDQIENHKLHGCSDAIVICPICKTESKSNEILNHIISVHQNEFKNKQEKIIELFDEGKSKLYQNTIEDLENSRRCIARLGSSGKYYCGKKLDGDPCLCCNGYCGPIEGCNCSACMELDIQSRRLPKGNLKVFVAINLKYIYCIYKINN